MKNTVSSKSVHAWHLTTNNFCDTDSIKSRLVFYKNKGLDKTLPQVVYYSCEGKETGKKGTLHLQQYIYFYNPLSFREVKLLFPRSHVETAIHSPYRGVTYCQKEGDYYELGSYVECINHYLTF
jgi:hypothetical protein